MTENREVQLSDALRNTVASFQMEGLSLSPSMQEMLLAVLNGERNLDECLIQIKAK